MAGLYVLADPPPGPPLLAALGAGLAVALLSAAGALAFGQRFHCQLCRGRLLGFASCQRNRRARKALGSYRLRVALAVIFTSSFRCPYCGEIFALRTEHDRPEA